MIMKSVGDIYGLNIIKVNIYPFFIGLLGLADLLARILGYIYHYSLGLGLIMKKKLATLQMGG